MGGETVARRKGIWWFRVLMDMPEDDAIQDLVDSYGAFGFGVWFSALFAIYRYGNETIAPMQSDKFVRRIARQLGETETDVRAVCDKMASVGLLDSEMWGEGKAVNEHACDTILAHWKAVEDGRTGHDVMVANKSD